MNMTTACRGPNGAFDGRTISAKFLIKPTAISSKSNANLQHQGICVLEKTLQSIFSISM